MTEVILLCSSLPFYIKKNKLCHCFKTFVCLFTESETSWGWEGPLEVVLPNPLAPAIPSRPCCPERCPDGFGSPRKDTVSLGNLLQFSVSLTVKVCSCVQMEPHMFQFVPTPSCPVTGHWWQEPGSIFFAAPLQMMIRVDKSLPELSFLLAKQSLLPHPLLIREVLQSLNPFVAFSWTPSSVCVSHTGHWDAQNWALLLWVVKGRITSVTLLLQPVPLAWCVAHCWLLFSSRTPGPSLPRGFPAGWLQDISMYGTVPPQRISPACRGP